MLEDDNSDDDTPPAPPPRQRKQTKRNRMAAEDPDDVTVAVGSTAGPSTVTASTVAITPARPDALLIPPPETPSILETFGPLDPKERTRPQGASVAMNVAREFFEDAQCAILSSFAAKGLGRPCKCGAAGSDTIFRCQDCFKPRLSCQSCMVHQHENNPFHRVEKWGGTHFSRISLNALGLVIQTCLDSGAKRCKQVSDTSVKTHAMSLGDHNGFHEITLEECSCVEGIGGSVTPFWRQLMDVGLFPASFKSPRTVFTQRVMKEFHIHCLASKKSAYDYIKALCKLTNNAFAAQVKDRYREFQFAYRIWRYLALQRRTGQAQGIDKHVPHRRPGSLTLRCPACPEVGFNISAETMKNALDSERHKFTLFLSVDGNFKLQRKNKRDDPDDVALNAGAGYFVETEEYRRYVKLAKPTEDLGTCSHLRAARMQNIAKFKHAVISGVVAVQCARHGFYLPQGMVDLKKGEAFALTDYAIVHALGEAMLLRFILITYDIWCQFSIHFPKRIAEWFPSMLAIILVIRGAIPKMHIHNHIERCQIEWNLNWLMYVAFTVGEMIETGWAEHNLTAGSTKEQNDGNRHDSVDDTSGNWNWDKMIGLAAALQRLYRVCQAELRKRQDNFEALTEKHSKELIAEWEAIDVTPRMEKGQFVSVFQSSFKKGPPTHAEAYAKLLRAEMESEAATTEHKHGDSGLITSGLLAERGSTLLAGLGRRLYKDVGDLRTRLVARVPALESHIVQVDPDSEKPEKEELFLPSHFTAAMRSELKLEALAQVEYELREGQAFDALGEVRTAIRTLNYNLQIKKAIIHGVGANTKSQNFLKTLSNDIQIAADTYRRARTALLALGLSETDGALQELRKSDLFGKSGQRVAMGHSKLVDSWFWTTIGRGANLSQEEEAEWEAEMERVKWFRDRAVRDRAVEQSEALEEEFRRAILWFERTAEVWDKLGDEGTEPGAKAYAYKQATMFRTLRDDCQTAHRDAPGLAEEDRKKAELAEAADRAETVRLEAEHRQTTGDSEDFSAYYETIEIFPQGT
ncbi:hypothetical protein DFH09DRAFT_1316801 [Mycena vulgaris]|nr:hypothetical protein DFH09DRAFT_1316801 [Mycena vulgaris]